MPSIVLAQATGAEVPPVAWGVAVLGVVLLALFVAFKVGRFLVKAALILIVLAAAALGVFWLFMRH